MNNLIEINNVAIGIKEFQNNRVVTFKDVDKVHNRPDGTARKAFNRNKNRFIENVDYYLMTRDNPMSVSWTLSENIPPKGITLLTESGYLMVSKVFDDDTAWDVQRKLVNGYFKSKDIQQPQTLDLSPIVNAIVLMQNDINEIKNNNQKQIQRKRYSRWQSRIFEKCNLLSEYLNVEIKTIFHNLYIELEDMNGDLDLNKYMEDYKYEMDVNTCFQLDVVEHYPKIKENFESLIDSILEKCGLLNKENNIPIKRKTIFDDILNN